MYKHSLFLLFFILAGSVSLLTAQSTQLQDLENQVLGASGVNRVEKTVQLVDALIASGQYDKATDWADEASDFAKKIKAPEWRAIALNREGKAMILAGKRKAYGRFLQSYEVLEDIGSSNKTLMLDNLSQLRQLAVKNGDNKDIAKIDEKINKIKGINLPSIASTPTPPAPVADVPVTRQELKQELGVLQSKLLSVNKMSEDEKMRFLQENKGLQLELAIKKAEIDLMTEAQMKASMMVMQQRYLLDSLGFEAGMDSLAIANSNLALQEADSKRRFYLAGLAAMLLLAGGSLFSYFKARQYAKTLVIKNNIIREEQQRSETLLLNILPALIAEELKAKGRTIARPFEDVGVLFADFIGFSKIAEQINPQQLVNDLDVCFQAFDEIVARHNLEKIKTIGDAYMCAGGLPNGGGSQMRDMVSAALEIQKWLSNWNIERDVQRLPRYEARIGIHCGPIVAGVVGSKKFAFDIWGDTVNIAARIEQAGESGRVNISGEAYQIVKDYYSCRYRGKIAAKNKGEIDMYFVE